MVDEKVVKAVKDYQQATDKLLLAQKRSEETDKAVAEASELVTSAKKKADELEQTALKNKKDPNDPQQAPKTVEARKQHREAELGLQSQVKKAEDASAQLKVAQANVEDTEKALQNIYGNRGSDSTGSLLAVSFVVFVLASSVGGICSFFVLRKIDGFNLKLLSNVKNITTKHEEVGNQIKALPALVNSAFASFQKEVDQLFRSQKKEIDALRETLEQYKQDAYPRNENVEAPLHDHFTSTIEAPRIDTFPVAVREYLTVVARESTPARDDPLHEGILVNDPNGAFILVRDPGMRAGLIYAIPKVPYFRSQEFHTYYDKYYICNKPSSGEVTIVEPATVDKVDGGWRLRDMGILEIHRS